MKRFRTAGIWILFLFVQGFPFNLDAQQSLVADVSNHTLIATDSLQPFWFTTGQHGKYQNAGSFSNLTDLYIGMYHSPEADSSFSFTWGVNGVVLLSSVNNQVNLNRFFAGLALRGWELKAGRFYDEILYDGLSVTNGNLARSGNTVPVPTLRFSTLGYKKLPFWENWFCFKGEYDEGLLYDNRYVENTHLHHKSLYGKFRLSQSFWLTVGFEHYVMWGGTSPMYGELPHSFKDYWRYVFALPGNDNFPTTDQLNSSGNQLGTFQFSFEKQFKRLEATLYLSHPFEDNSGLMWHNWPDNLLGIYIRTTDTRKMLNGFVLEFINTRQQSIRDSLYFQDGETGVWKMKEYDNYYNHSVYRSGFTYEGLPLSAPLFFPVKFENEIPAGIRSNRFYAFHTGLTGWLGKSIGWKGMLTYTRHLGTYSTPYTPAQNTLSGLLEINCHHQNVPFDIGISAAADFTSYAGKNAAIQLSVSRSW